MAEMTVKQQLTKEETRDAIFETLNRFKKFILDINDNSKSVKGSELDRLASQMAENNFISAMTRISPTDLGNLDSEGHRQLLSICGQLSEKYSLGVSIPKDVEVLGDNAASPLIQDIYDVDLSQISYFLNKYKSVSNWEYSGHGTFIAKKNATLWELGGIYWSKLFELPENPDKIRIGDEIKLRKEVLDTIYEVSTSDVTGEYTFDPKSPEAKDLIFSVISFCAGSSDTVPKIVKYGFTGKDVKGAIDTFTKAEETTSKLSYFIQQYTTEGKEEDGWKKFITVASFLGPVFGFLGLLSNASVEENKYQIVQYNQRKAFINSAQDEIERIQKIQSQINEKELQNEINYLRFLEQQIKMLDREIELNKKRDTHQLIEIRYLISQQVSSNDWKDTRYSKSPANYYNIDYHKLFEELK